MNNLPKILQSSANPEKLSLTIKGLLAAGVLAVGVFAGVQLPDAEIANLGDALVSAIQATVGAFSAWAVVYGILRKLFKLVVKNQPILEIPLLILLLLWKTANAQEITIETVAIESTITNTLEKPQEAPEQPLAVKRLDYLTKQDILDLIELYVPEGHRKTAWDIINCESPKQMDGDTMYYYPKGQSTLFYSYTDEARGIYKGDKERSFGIVQISLPHWPEVTLEQAQDPHFSIQFLTEHIEDNPQYWSCYKGQIDIST